MKYLLLSFFLFLGFLGQAQKDIYLKGLNYFEAKNYPKALEFFYADKYGNGNKDLLLRRVICNYYLGNLDEAKKDVSVLLGFDVAPDETYLFIGKIFHEEGLYKRAIENYKIYLKRLSPKSDQRDEVIHTIKQCGNAIRLQYADPIAFVDNYGPEINTIGDEFRMIQSPNFDSKYYFTSARKESTGGKRNPKGMKDENFGEYNSDMYSIEMIQGEWMPAQNLNPFINSSRDEIALDFSSDGSILYYMKGPDYTAGTIYSDTFKVDKKNQLNPPRFNAPIEAETGDVYLHFFNDSTIVFSSNRKGGYGGYDLYVTAYRYGKWSNPKNLGPNVNSRYDEIAPNISNNGKIIFFSSNRLESLGAYDVFFSDFNMQDLSWAKAVNAGAPINSAGDDIGFYISQDGFTASLSSDRKSGYGGFDLYVVYFKNQLKAQNQQAPLLAFIANEDFVPTKNVAINNTANSKQSKSTKKTNSPSTKKLKKTKKPKKNKKDKTKASNAKKDKKPEVVKVEKPAPKVVSTIKKEYVINTIFYTSDQEVLSPTNKQELNVIGDILEMYPNLDLEIKAHTKEEGLEAYDLYFSIKRAEKIAEYLISKGIEKKRIQLKGYGANYPIAKSETGGKKSKIAEKVNSRIEFKINKTETQPIRITNVEPYLVDYLRDPKGELFKTVEDGLSYRVQIANVKQMYQNQVLLLYNDSMIERDFASDNYRYTLGLYESYNDAKALVKDLANYNITGAFVVPYINGQRISNQEVVEYAKYYNDLINYMQYNDE